MMAMKKILKKFDKKFSAYYGYIAPKYILDNLLKKNSDLEYLLQFKIIDEASCICQSNLKLLKECAKVFFTSNEVNQDMKNDFFNKAHEISNYIKEIDELIYFKIQYKEWFYFLKKDAPIISSSNLYKNIMFNPILFSAYHKDDLMNKFLTSKEAIKEIEKMQLPLSTRNKINIIFIFIQTFFYNTLISGIYPLIFTFMENKNDKVSNNVEDASDQGENNTPYSFFIIASTYFFSYFSIIIYYYFGTKYIKEAFIISYVSFILGSILYIFSVRKDKEDNIIIKSYIIFLMIISRVLVGFGGIPTLGKKYILNYASKYFLPYISKMYVFFSIIGHSIGPLISVFLLEMEDIEIMNCLYFSKYNFIGWYGLIMSLLLLIAHLILFTPPNSLKFSKFKQTNIKTSYGTIASQNSQFLAEDLEDTQDKEFYRLQKEMKMKNESNNNSIICDFNDNNVSTYKEDTYIKNLNISQEKIEIKDEDIKSEDNEDNIIIKRSSSLPKIIDTNNIVEDTNENEYLTNPLLISNNNNDRKDETQKEGNFVHINMIPRTIDDLIRKEKKTFGYLNKNLLIILIILFFNNLLKENYIAYCSYFAIDKLKNTIESIYIFCLISLSYILELISMLFILPFHKLNKLFKKLLIFLMALSIVFMIASSNSVIIDDYYFIYFMLISLVILLSSIIEVVTSCYLAYLTPPEWKFSHYNAGALPLYIMILGKICGCLICLSAFSKNHYLNHYFILFITVIGYTISGLYVFQSKKFRIKAIARIMRKIELE